MKGSCLISSSFISSSCLIPCSSLICGEIDRSTRSFLHAVQPCFSLPWGQGLHAAQLRFDFPWCQGLHSAHHNLPCRGGTGCTPRTCILACRQGTGCTPRSRLSACREGRGCTPRSSFSPYREGKGVHFLQNLFSFPCGHRFVPAMSFAQKPRLALLARRVSCSFYASCAVCAVTRAVACEETETSPHFA